MSEYGTPEYHRARVQEAVAGCTDETSHHVFRLQPGNGTSYDLSFVRRAGGGWLVVWDSGRWSAIVRRGFAFSTTGRRAELAGDSAGHAELEWWGNEITNVDRRVIAEVCGALIRAGVLG